MTELRRRTPWVVAVALLLCSPAAAAQPASEPVDALERAKSLFRTAEEHYRGAVFDKALAGYQEAYNLCKRPTLLFNVAQCHRQLGNHERALFFYRLYISDWYRKHPDQEPPYHDEVKARIQRLVTLMQEQQRRAEAQRRRQEQQQQQEKLRRERKEREAAARARQRREEARRTSAPSPPPEGESGRWRPVAGWTALGAGAAALVSGIVLGALAAAKTTEYDEARDAGQTYYALQELERAGDRLETAQVVTLVVGGLLAAGGASLLLWERAEKRRGARISLAPLVDGASYGIVGGLCF